MRFDDHYFIAPDNGLLSLILCGRAPQELVVVDQPAYFRPQVSRTFHGRDIFAPVAAHLALGTSLGNLGTRLAAAHLHHLAPPPAPRQGPGFIAGTIVQVDHFGNLTTNIEHRSLKEMMVSPDAADVRICIGDHILTGLSACYADTPAGTPVALFGSRGLLEVAVNQGDAGRFFGVARGASVRLEW
jgi:S-adenosylmethionine hydrolase